MYIYAYLESNFVPKYIRVPNKNKPLDNVDNGVIINLSEIFIMINYKSQKKTN